MISKLLEPQNPYIEVDPLFFADADLAGQIAGCVRVKHEDDTSVKVIVGYGTVGDDGAVYAEQHNPISRIEDRVVGFIDPVAVTVEREQGKGVRVLRYGTVDSGAPNKNLFAGLNKIDRPYGAYGTWAIGSREILSIVMTKLEKVEAPDLYPAVYYNLAMIAKRQLADPTMHDQTEAHCKSILDQAPILQEVISTDETMAQTLEAGTINQQEIIVQFIASRELVAKLEAQTTIELPDYMQKWLLSFYDSITTHYLNPTSPHNLQSYGHVLTRLIAGDTTSVSLNVRSEIAGYLKRLHRVQYIGVKLTDLAMFERQLLES